MNEAREILNRLVAVIMWNEERQDTNIEWFGSYPEEFDTALKQLRELVEGKKKKLFGCHSFFGKEPDREIMRYNHAISDIADMIYKEEK